MDAIFSVLFESLKQNLWVGLLSILLYFIYKGGPKVIDLFKDYFQTKKEELINIKLSIERGDERLSTAVDKISQAIFSFEKALLGVKADLADDIKESQHSIKLDLASTREELKKEIRDNKIENLIQKTQSVPQKRDKQHGPRSSRPDAGDM